MSRKRRLVELGKSVLIALLACSAALLAAHTQFSTALFPPGEEQSSLLSAMPAQPADASQAAAVVRLTVVGPTGRYGVQYDTQSTDASFQGVSGLLRDALDGPGEARELTQEEWRRGITASPCVTFHLAGALPLSVLSGWLSGQPTVADDTAADLLCLCLEGENVFLYYRSGETFYARSAAHVTPADLTAAVESYTANGALYAFEDPDYSALDPYTLLLPTSLTPQVYSVSVPSYSTEQLLSALSFLSEANQAYSASDGQVIRSGGETLRLLYDGTVVYTASSAGLSRYLIPSSAQEEPSLFEMAQETLTLAQNTLGPLCGDARLFLSGLARTEEGWELTYDYYLSGAQVVLPQGHAAVFSVKDGAISSFTLRLRSYTPSGSTSIVLPELQAMAAMGAMEAQGQRLLLAYFDDGAAAYADWSVQ